MMIRHVAVHGRMGKKQEALRVVALACTLYIPPIDFRRMGTAPGTSHIVYLLQICNIKDIYCDPTDSPVQPFTDLLQP